MKIVCVGDKGGHSVPMKGHIKTSGQDGTLKAGGDEVAVEGAIFHCIYHGNKLIVPITTKTRHNGKLVITEGAKATCGAVIAPSDRGVEVE